MQNKFIYLSIAAALTMPQLLKAQNVGIGTATPAATLDVNGNVKISGGTPGAGKVLTSDANGVATWSAAGVVQPNTFVLSDNVADANLLINGYTNIASTVFQSKTASSSASNANNWNKSSSFISERADAKVIAGNGNEFIVFGGYDKVSSRSDGGIYNPMSDTWKVIPDMNDGLDRSLATVAWTGSKLIVWGGGDGTTFTNTGKIYDPTTGLWTSMNTAGAPTARWSNGGGYDATTNELIIWGGDAGGLPLANGAKYNLGNNTWTTISSTGAPAARTGFAFGVNDGKLFMFGGRIQSSGVFSNESFHYNIASNTWVTLPATALAGRWNIKAAYTGSGYIIFGGNNATTSFADGAIFNTASNIWSPMTTSGGLTLGFNVAYGGGYYINGNGKYDLSTQTWNALPATVRFVNGMAANAVCLFYFGGKVSGTGGAGNATNQMLDDGLRYFWAQQTVTTHSTNPMALYLYKKN